MGEFANGFVNKLIAILLSIFLIGINLYFVGQQVMNAHLSIEMIALIGNFIELKAFRKSDPNFNFS